MYLTLKFYFSFSKPLKLILLSLYCLYSCHCEEPRSGDEAISSQQHKIVVRNDNSKGQLYGFDGNACDQD